jgi:hypothetical protein
MPTASMNGVDETSRANGSRAGGIQAFWTAEAGLKGASQPKFRNIKMDLDKLTGLCYATDELLQDTSALEAWIKEAFNTEFTFKLEDAIINGTGSGMPLGILNSGASSPSRRKPARPTAPSPPPTSSQMWARCRPVQEERGLAHQRRRPAGSGHPGPADQERGRHRERRRRVVAGRQLHPARHARRRNVRLAHGPSDHRDRVQRHARRRSATSSCSIRRSTSRSTRGRPSTRRRSMFGSSTTRPSSASSTVSTVSRSGARSQTPYKGSNTRSPFVVLAAR